MEPSEFKRKLLTDPFFVISFLINTSFQSVLLALESIGLTAANPEEAFNAILQSIDNGDARVIEALKQVPIDPSTLTEEQKVVLEEIYQEKFGSGGEYQMKGIKLPDIDYAALIGALLPVLTGTGTKSPVTPPPPPEPAKSNLWLIIAGIVGFLILIVTLILVFTRK